MNKVKISNTKKKLTKPIAPFKTMDEEAAFWDTHNTIKDIDEGTIVGFHQANKTDTLTVRFEPSDLQKLKEQAFHMGIGPTTLVRMFVRKQLHSQTE